MKKEITDKIYNIVITTLLWGAIILGISLCCKKCSAQQKVDINNIPVMEYNDVDDKIYDDYIPIYADGVVDFIYCTQDEEYIIEYMDDDYFDIDNLPQTINCTNGDSVVSIYCSEKDFYEYLEWYNSIDSPARDQEIFYAPHETFAIKEQWVGNEENGYWYYKLIKREK